MALSIKEIRSKKYLPFPGHTEKASKRYHSSNLPDPNVVRIEVLSPSVRAQYLNSGIYAMTNRFQQSLMGFFLDADASEPFYGFFDPENEGIEFGVSADWRIGDHGFGEVAGAVKKVTGILPVVGGAGTKIVNGVEEVAKFAEKWANRAGLDTASTGACTLRDFKGVDFKFDKKVICRWYMPEQENMARHSIARLLKLAYVRNMNLSDGDYFDKLTKAAAEVTNNQEWKDMMSAMSDAGNTVMNMPVVGDIMGKIGDLAGNVKNDAQEAGFIPNADTMKVLGDVMKQVANGGIDVMIKMNAFFGGNLTINPFPVRLTMGHILDIEPLVIKGVEIKGSQEQFISDDGTHIPLFVTAEITLGMWMVPDPKKGFIRWMGDDVFNSGRFLSSAKSDGKSGTTSSKSGARKKGVSR